MLKKIFNKLFGKSTATVEAFECEQHTSAESFSTTKTDTENNQPIKEVSQKSIKALIKDSTHWDGYKREEAVFKIGELGNVQGLPALLERANDWVWQVRKAAYQAIKKLLKTDNAKAFIDHLGAVYHLRNCYRQDHADLVDIIEKYLAKNHVSWIIQSIDHHDPMVARSCYDIAVSYELLSQEKLLSIGLKHRDVVVKIRSSRLLQLSSSKDLIALALTSSFVPIRMRAIRLLLQQCEPAEQFVPDLFDQSASIRHIVVRFLVDHDIDVEKIYADALVSEKPQKIRCAIWGLGYLQKVEYEESIRPFLYSESASLRQQALDTLSQLVGLGIKAEIIAALSDPSKRVAYEALKALREHGIQLPANELLEIYRHGEVGQTKKVCLAYTRYMNKWASYQFLLEVMNADQDLPMLASDFQVAMRRWLSSANKKFTVPTQDQLKALKNLYLTSPNIANDPDITNTLRSIKAIN